MKFSNLNNQDQENKPRFLFGCVNSIDIKAELSKFYTKINKNYLQLLSKFLEKAELTNMIFSRTSLN